MPRRALTDDGIAAIIDHEWQDLRATAAELHAHGRAASAAELEARAEMLERYRTVDRYAAAAGTVRQPAGSESSVKRDSWNERYAAQDLVWSAGPNQFLVAEAADLAPGTALDLAAGEGRNAVWLAAHGWQVTAVDFSEVGLGKARQRADAAGVRVETVCADVTTWEPTPGAFDLVVVFYLQLPEAERRAAHRLAASGVAPGGVLLVVGHDRANLTEGHGGPQDDAVLFTPDDVVDDLDGTDLVVERAERARRRVDTDDGVRAAIDALVRLRRPS